MQSIEKSAARFVNKSMARESPRRSVLRQSDACAPKTAFRGNFRAVLIFPLRYKFSATGIGAGGLYYFTLTISKNGVAPFGSFELSIAIFITPSENSNGIFARRSPLSATG